MDRHLEDAVGQGWQKSSSVGFVRRRLPDSLGYEATALDRVSSDIGGGEWKRPRPGRSHLDDPKRGRGARDHRLGPDGLLASIFTEDLRRGLRFAEAARAGWVNVNEGSNYWESHLPFGGRAGSKSGVGRVGGRHAMDAFTELKTVVLNLG